MSAPDPATAEGLQHEIERTRERLGQTVEELAAKADMKAQARAKTTEMKARAAQMSGRMRQSQAMARSWPLGMTAAGVLMMVAAVIWRRRKT